MGADTFMPHVLGFVLIGVKWPRRPWCGVPQAPRPANAGSFISELLGSFSRMYFDRAAIAANPSPEIRRQAKGPQNPSAHCGLRTARPFAYPRNEGRRRPNGDLVVRGMPLPISLRLPVLRRNHEGDLGHPKVRGNFDSFCPKTPTGDTDKVNAFRKWAVRHPEMWGKQEIFGVVLALRQAWPSLTVLRPFRGGIPCNRIACLSVPPRPIFDDNH